MKAALQIFFLAVTLLFLFPSSESFAQKLWVNSIHADTSGDVTFQVNMKIQMLEGKFLPGSGDIVRLAGSFDSWGSSTDTLADLDGDSIYTKTLTLPVGNIQWKYLKSLRGGSDWEANQPTGSTNREDSVVGGNQTLPVVYFSNDSVYVPPTTDVPVTFQVNMRIKMEEGTFLPGSGDIVRVAGGFNSWGSSTDTLSDLDGDSIYSKTIQLSENASIQYKFLKTLRGGLDWENVSNRPYTVPVGGGTIPAPYFDDDSVYTAPTTSVPVTFQVNMKVKMLETTFQPGSGDIVTVPGSFNGWTTSADTLTDLDGDSIYTKTITLSENQALFYKFYKTVRGGLDWENNQPTGSGNREYTVPTGGGPIVVAYFNDDSVANTPINANINFRVDMSVYEQLGWFQPANGDSLQVRGPFNGWGGTVLTQNPFIPSQFHAIIPYSGTSFDDIQYKMFIKLDAATAETRFPGFSTNNDGVQYEHPAERGDGNRIFNVGNGGNLSSPSYYFSSINPGGIIPAGDTVTVTLSVNMGPATRYVIAFDPLTDTVFVVWQDALSRFAQAKIQGSFPDLLMSPASPGDSVFQATFNIIGPAHYNMQYTYRYIRMSDNAQVDQGGGLGGQNLFNSRFIQPTPANSPLAAGVAAFPRFYSAPTDGWQKNSPLPYENPPFNAVTGVLEGKNPGVPLVYKLENNYPNPFNPSTKINFSIPATSTVTLKVYNLLGEEVATLVNERKDAGNYFVVFDAHNVASGMYFYRLEAGAFRETKKMLLLK